MMRKRYFSFRNFKKWVPTIGLIKWEDDPFVVFWITSFSDRLWMKIWHKKLYTAIIKFINTHWLMNDDYAVITIIENRNFWILITDRNSFLIENHFVEIFGHTYINDFARFQHHSYWIYIIMYIIEKWNYCVRYIWESLVKNFFSVQSFERWRHFHSQVLLLFRTFRKCNKTSQLFSSYMYGSLYVVFLKSIP